MTRAVLLVIVCACWSTPSTHAPPNTVPTPAARPEPREAPAPRQSVPIAATERAPSGQGTALRTRAHPFAVYIALMHRKLHPQWADHVLASLDNKPVTDPLNDPKLEVKLEIAVDAQGAVTADVVSTSGETAFDDAAIDAFHAAGPFDPPPDTIRSSDGLVHLTWTLYRDQRSCGTFGVDPLIR